MNNLDGKAKQDQENERTIIETYKHVQALCKSASVTDISDWDDLEESERDIFRIIYNAGYAQGLKHKI